MKATFSRIFCLLLMLTLLPLAALGEGREDEPVIRSEFTFQPRFYASGFPDDGEMNYQDWETFLNKLTISGTSDVQRPLTPVDSYTLMEAALCINGKEAIPFRYENYGYSRFVTSPALGGDTVYFNMLNFDIFMLKPYIFLDLPTNLLSMLIYPEQFTDCYNRMAELFTAQTEGQSFLSWDAVYDLASTLSTKMANDKYSRYECLCSGLLSQIYGSDLVFGDLCSLAESLEIMDPEQQGLTILREGGETRYLLGEVPLITCTETSFSMTLTGASSGYTYTGGYERQGDTLRVFVSAEWDGEFRLGAEMTASGLFTEENNLQAAGDIVTRVWGPAISENLDTEEINFTLQYEKTLSSSLYPREETLAVTLLHPETGSPCLGFEYRALVSEVSGEEVINRIDDYKAQDLPETFCMNNASLEVYKEKYLKTLALSLVPVVLEVPGGVISDLVFFVTDSGILSVLGIELY